MPKVSFDSTHFHLPPTIGNKERDELLRKVSQLRIEGLLQGNKTLDELRDIARQMCLECNQRQIELGEVLEELGYENNRLRKKIEAKELKTLEKVIDFLRSKEELKTFIRAMQRAIDNADSPRRFLVVGKEVLKPGQIEFDLPKREVKPEIEFPKRPRPNIDIQS